MVKPSLAQGAALLPAAETIQQSVSGNPCAQPAAVRLKDFSMSRAASTAPLRKNIWRRFGRSRRGSAAVEFALVAPVFFALLFAIIETAIVFFAGQVLETMTANAARFIMTGTEQKSGANAADFHQVVCNQIPALFSCPNVYVDVQTVPAFSNVNFSSPLDANGIFTPPSNYQPGGSSSIVVVRVFYPWQLFVTGLGFNISNMAGSKRLLTATAVFQNEPY
jgi:Flp pilus assembly protein TadG